MRFFKVLLFSLLLTLSFASYSLAGNVFNEALENTKTVAGATKDLQSSISLEQAIGRVIKGFLGILGILGVIIFLYSGLLYMTSKGKTDVIEKAKKQMFYVAIGMVIILGAYSLTAFVINQISTV